MTADLLLRTQSLDWDSINESLLRKGFAITKPFLNEIECASFQKLFSNESLYRSTIDMKRYSFGKGVYRYFKYPLPNEVQLLREEIYEKIAITANEWAERSHT